MSTIVPPDPAAGNTASQTSTGVQVNINSVYMNTSQEVIVITEDKALLCLHRHVANVTKQREWQTPFAMLLTLVLTFATTSFHDFLIPKDSWLAVFVLATAGATIWLTKTLVNLRKPTSIEHVLTEMKTGSIPIPPGP